MRKTKKITLASLCAALATVFLSIGMMIGVMDMTAALLASFIVLFCFLEMGYRYALSVFGVTAVLALILMPNASSSWMFLLMFGYMPISKFGFERICKKIVWLAWIPKLILFNAVYAVMLFALGELLGFTVENSFGIPPQAVYAAFFIVGNLMYAACDVLYGRLAKVYLIRLRERFVRYLK
jgi:hypothetical protein